MDRDRELGHRRACLADVLDGRPRVATIQGPAGIGKTSLLHEVRDEARAAGATVLSARGSQLERGVPPRQTWRRLKGVRSAVDPSGVLVANHRVPRLYENGLPTP